MQFRFHAAHSYNETNILIDCVTLSLVGWFLVGSSLPGDSGDAR